MRFDKLIVNLLIIFVFSNSASAQFLEIGGGLGITHYKGEIYPNFKPFAFNGGSNAFVRYNFVKQGISVKGTGMTGYLSAKDSRTNAPFNQARGFSFLTNIFDAGLQIEYNFLDFRSTAAHNSDWTPYVFGGLNYYGIFNAEYKTDPRASDIHSFVGYTYKPTNAQTASGYSIPFGVGFKKVLRPRLNLSVEFGTRKTFRDIDIDNIGFKKDGIPNFDTAVSNSNPKIRQVSMPNTQLKDMYYYTNVSLSFVFYKIHCPPSR